MVMRDLSILLRAGRVLREPVYLFGNDIKEYFNHFANAPEELWKTGTTFLGRDVDFMDRSERGATTPPPPAYRDEHGNHLLFVAENRMGFRLSPNSNIAQQFSEVINALLREDVDSMDAEYLRNDRRPEAIAWARARDAVAEASGGHEHRLFFVHMYTDDNIISVVGAARAVRLLQTWRRLTADLGLRMAIPEKRAAGTRALWLGMLFFATLGVVAVPRAKLLRAATALYRAERGELDLSQYRSLVGLLEHLRTIGRLPKRTMWGLNEPHRIDGASQHGPSALVVPSSYMRVHLRQWLGVLSTCAGAPVTASLRRMHLPDSANSASSLPLSFDIYADAATDSPVPGMGGCMHGYYWYFPLDAECLVWLHISILELLASALNAITFSVLLPPDSMAVLRSDALNTPWVLAAGATRQPAMRLTHAAILAQPEYSAVASRLLVAHVYGDSNPMADAVSHAEWTRFAAVCRAIRIKPTKLDVPPTCRTFFQTVLATLCLRSIPVQPSAYVPRPPEPSAKRQRSLTSMERCLDTAHSCNVTGDGPLGLPYKFNKGRPVNVVTSSPVLAPPLPRPVPSPIPVSSIWPSPLGFTHLPIRLCRGRPTIYAPRSDLRVRK
jgi:hypothetical protein